MLTRRNLTGTAERVIKILACCKLLNGLALKHHLPDLDMNSTVMTSSTVICALLAPATIAMQSVVFHLMRIVETSTDAVLLLSRLGLCNVLLLRITESHTPMVGHLAVRNQRHLCMPHWMS